jgi:hypothetical protein
MANTVANLVDVRYDITDRESTRLKELKFWLVCWVINQSVSVQKALHAPLMRCSKSAKRGSERRLSKTGSI